jgi:hypothetical protein
LRYLIFFLWTNHFFLINPIRTIFTFVVIIYKISKLYQKTLKYGSIIKREALTNAAVKSNSGHLILASEDPFPGFYCSKENPADNNCKEFPYYLPISSLPCCHEDKICKWSLELNKKTNIQSCAAHIWLLGKFVKAIRIKNLNNNKMDEVIEFFSAHNLSFYKDKKINTYLSQIYLKGFFEVARPAKDIFRNTISPDLYYLLIPFSIEWKLFEQLITYQKSKGGFTNYDAAIGYWIEKPAFTNFIRIYGKKLKLDELEKIRKVFIQNLKEYQIQMVLI